MDEDIKRFLAFWKQHGQEEMRVRGGVLQSAGCNGDYGCCSDSCDLGGLADSLQELVGVSDV